MTGERRTMVHKPKQDTWGAKVLYQTERKKCILEWANAGICVCVCVSVCTHVCKHCVCMHTLAHGFVWTRHFGKVNKN